MRSFVSRAGIKLHFALTEFGMDVRGLVCADLGSNIGGFVDCLLQWGAASVYAIEKGYGVLEWKLRKDARVVVMERTNAMHVSLPQRVSVVTIDVAWTRQRNILPSARRIVRDEGCVVTLIKPHYEAEKSLLRNGILPPEAVEPTVERVKGDILESGFKLIGTVQSPILGGQGNIEVLALLRPLLNDSLVET